MDLNYHHLQYFWATAKHGSITAACRELHLTPQTVSAQIKALELALGEELFLRQGRRLVLTDVGQVVYRYADEIFNLGRELTETLRGHPTTRSLVLHVGMADVLPKLITHHVLEPALQMDQPVRIVCEVGKPDDLLAQLSVHRLDVVITDSPVPAGSGLKAFNHPLGQCGVSFLAHADIARKLKKGFPSSLNDAPVLLPTMGTTLRNSLDRWFDDRDVHPDIVGEFTDSAVVKVFGQAGAGVFAVPSIVAGEVRRQYKVSSVGEADGLVEKFYAISFERRIRHPAVAAICDAARDTMFAA